MRAAHPLSPHAFSTLRRLTALTAVMTLTLTMVSCSIGESNGDPVISSLTAQKADDTVPRNSKSDMDNEPLSSAVGTVSMITSDENRKKGAVSGDLTTTVVSRERSTDKFQWAVSIKPAVANQKRTEYADNAQSAMSENMDLSSTGSAVVSPDGRYLSLILLPASRERQQLICAHISSSLTPQPARRSGTPQSPGSSWGRLSPTAPSPSKPPRTTSRPAPGREPSPPSP